MKRLFIVTLLLCGCSSTQQWVQDNGGEVDQSQLTKALAECKYQEKMRQSNEMLLAAAQDPRTKEYSVENDKYLSKSGQQTEESFAKRDEDMRRANQQSRIKASTLANEAYQCMQYKGFSKSTT
jgi:hypothetical protein